MKGGVGCFGSPIDRLIGAKAAAGVMPANSLRSRSNGYGCRRVEVGIHTLTFHVLTGRPMPALSAAV